MNKAKRNKLTKLMNDEQCAMILQHKRAIEICRASWPHDLRAIQILENSFRVQFQESITSEQRLTIDS
jgi:hypothetical protein